jgi:hypothetical protein
MKGSREREVVLEIERVRLVRKRVRSTFSFCRDCSRSTDFIPLTLAAQFFGVTAAELLDFTRVNQCHFSVGNEGEINLCVADLLAAMNLRIKRGAYRLLGAKENEEKNI